MAIDTKPIIARISQSEIDEMIETYDDMDYEVNKGYEQLHAFIQELREIRMHKA